MYFGVLLARNQVVFERFEWCRLKVRKAGEAVAIQSLDGCILAEMWRVFGQYILGIPKGRQGVFLVVFWRVFCTKLGDV